MVDTDSGGGRFPVTCTTGIFYNLQTKNKKGSVPQDSLRHFQACFAVNHSLLEMGRNSEFLFVIDGRSPPF